MVQRRCGAPLYLLVAATVLLVVVATEAPRRCPYEVLGVEKQSNEKTIKRAYRKLSLEYHPDKNHGDASAQEKFVEVSAAYEVLSDPQKRRDYDRFGFGGGNQMMDPFSGGFDPFSGGFDPFDMFKSFHGFGDGDPFGDFGGLGGDFGDFGGHMEEFGGDGGGGGLNDMFEMMMGGGGGGGGGQSCSTVTNCVNGHCTTRTTCH